MNRKRCIRIIKRGCVVLLIIGLLFIHFILPRVLTEKRSALKSFFKGYPVYEYNYAFGDANRYVRKKINVKSFDSISISGYITYSKLKNYKGTIILLPNSGNTKYFFLEHSERLADRGYNSVAIDFRAFGESGGKFSTYGVKEKRDIQSVIDYLIKKEGLYNIGIWGQSLGAAVALQAMGIEPRIKFGIVESTYTDYKTNMDTYFTRITGLNMPRFTNYLVNRSGKIGDFDADDASPIIYAQNITQPILIVHGEKDPVFDIKYGKAVFNAVKSADKTFIKIDAAGHINVWQKGGDKYFDDALNFLDRVSKCPY